jgi:uncharacterized protein DUF87
MNEINISEELGFIGREFNGVTKKNIKILASNPLFIDFRLKQHTFICAKSGGGKSYLAGVCIEEIIRTLENYGGVLIDPMGIHCALNKPNDQNLVNLWNNEINCNEVQPISLEGKYSIWVPRGDVKRFESGSYHKVFSLRARDFSPDTLCYAFSMEILDPQVNLFRKMKKRAEKENPNYTLIELMGYISMEGKEAGFKVQTIESLITKLDALAALGIISNDGIPIHEMIQEGKCAIFDLSMSSPYTSRILVNYLSEKILYLRKRISRLITKARVDERLIEKPFWYIPPTQMIIDEAHKYLSKSYQLKTCIKEGRNCGMMITAISQSPDLTKSVYTNLSHLFVGPLVYKDDLDKIYSMIPVEKTPRNFREQIKALTTGCFYYYNIDEKIEKRIKVRVRKTLHPASTELIDERKYFYNLQNTNKKQKPIEEIIKEPISPQLAISENKNEEIFDEKFIEEMDEIVKEAQVKKSSKAKQATSIKSTPKEKISEAKQATSINSTPKEKITKESLILSKKYKKLNDKEFSIILLNKIPKETILDIEIKEKGIIGQATVFHHNEKLLADIPESFLRFNTDTTSISDAMKELKKDLGELTDFSIIIIHRLRWIKVSC